MNAGKLTIGLLALLLAGLTATAANAGETRKARGRADTAKEDEKERGRYARTAPSDRRATKETRTDRGHAKVPPARRPEVRHVPARKPVDVRRSVSHGKPVDVRHPVSPRTRRPVHPGHRVETRHGVVVRRHHHRPAMRWVPGHHEIRVKKVWVAGHYRREKVPAVYGMRTTPFGDKVRFCIVAETYRRVWVPGHYRKVKERVWVPGHWTRIDGCR
jgi:hypothetical protein